MKLKTFLLISFLSLLLIAPTPVSANLFNDFLNEMNNKLKDGVEEVIDLVTPGDSKNKVLTLDSEIKLAEGGDVNKNGEIDSGEYLKFTYRINNPTNNAHQSLTLKTNIDTNKLNGVRNVIGTFNLSAQDNTITIPNLTINPNQKRVISFETQINFNKNVDELISTEGELVSDPNNILLKSQKKEVKVKKMDEEKFNEFVHITKE